jgi:acetylornithine deacetylase
MNTSWERVSAAIEARGELAKKLISEMVRMPSIDDESQVQEYIADFWKSRQVKIDTWSPDVAELSKHRAFVEVGYDYTGRQNMVVTLPGSGGGRSVTLNGHMDVVPADPSGVWTHVDPFSGVIENNRVYGRGSVDMKAGLAIAMIVVDALLETGVRLKGDVQLQFVVDEENGGNGTLACITRGYRSDATIFLEPTDPKFLLVSSRGAHFFRITVKGIEGGIEYQYSLPNAIDKAMLLFRATQDYALWRASQAKLPLYDHDPTKIPAAICKIHAGNWPSTLPAQCIMEGSLECLPGEDIDEIRFQFAEYLQEVARQDPWLKENPPEVEWFGLRYEAGLTPVDHPFVKALSHATQEITGTTPQIVGGGGSDLRLPVLYADSPSVLFGPSGGAIHSTDEYVELDSVMQVAQIVGRFILDWCQVAENGA